MIITAVKQLSPDMLLLSFDGGEDVKCTLGAVTELRLCSGKEIDEESYNELLRLTRRDMTRLRALEMVSRRMYSKKELLAKLMQKGIDEETAGDCVSWLSENRFIDEERYAEALARHVSGKGYGAGRLRAELSRRGVERELWEESMESMPDNSGRIDRFIASKLKDPEDKEQLRKISAALYRRGFSWDEIRAALRRFNAETEDC